MFNIHTVPLGDPQSGMIVKSHSGHAARWQLRQTTFAADYERINQHTN
jgi:hypothetical protein